MMSVFLRFFSIALVSLVFIQCIPFLNPFSKDSNDDQDAILLLGLVALSGGGGSRQVEETRPFRARTVTLKENGSVHVYDWNQDREVPLRTEDTAITGIDKIWSSESGRFTYAKVGNAFRVIDSTINLSPHGDHFHYDRANYYRTINNNRTTGLNTPTNTTPHSVRARNGWVAFFYRGNDTDTESVVRFVKETDIVTQENIPVVLGPGIGNGVAGDAVMLSDEFALVPDAGNADGPIELSIHKRNGGVWTKIGSNILCTDYKGLATTQVPKPGASFTNLESGYAKIHYALILCLGDNKLVRYEDGEANPTVESWNIDGGVGLTRVQSLFNNDNIERGGRNTKPLFIANAGNENQSGFYVLNAQDKTDRVIQTDSYPGHLLGSETRSGNEIYIVSNTGKLITYNTNDGSKIREMNSDLPVSELNSVRFYSTWQAGFLTHSSTIHEFNIQEDFKARTIDTGNTIQQMSIKGFFGAGADYDGPEHSIRGKKKTGQ
ncbi:MAG: hypothetical protein JJT78_08525 [Leptospira sp.]|nr:hypothetical protein [Leptospira sp.]